MSGQGTFARASFSAEYEPPVSFFLVKLVSKVGL
jgi:hypothetical protein